MQQPTPTPSTPSASHPPISTSPSPSLSFPTFHRSPGSALPSASTITSTFTAASTSTSTNPSITFPTSSLFSPIPSTSISKSASSGFAALSTIKQKPLKSSCIILDIGQVLTRAGFAGESRPRHIIHTPWGGTIHLTRGSCVKTLQEWMEICGKMLRIIYFQYLLVNPRDRRLLLLDPSYTWSDTFRTALVRTCLDMDVPAIMFLPSVAAPIYCTGKETGISVDVGWGETRCVPIYRGFPIPAYTIVVPIGMLTIHERFRSLLSSTMSSTELSTISTHEWDDLIVRTCYIHGIGMEETTHTATSITLSLSATQRITIPGEIRATSADALFGANDESISIVHAVADCFLKCPPEVRAAISASLILSGGTASLPGFTARFINELNREISKQTRYEPIRGLVDRIQLAASPFTPSIMGWAAGSIVGSLDVADDAFLSADTLSQRVADDRIVHDWPSYTAGSSATAHASALTAASIFPSYPRSGSNSGNNTAREF